MSEDLDCEAGKELFAKLVEYNDSQVEKSVARGLLISVFGAEEKLIGGIRCDTRRGWLNVFQLWVAETERGSGLGTELLLKAEAEALARGCIGAHLTTYSFQAKDFYLKNGYEVFGELKDCPPGHSNFFLRKVFPTR
jgi:GNAT superfamily N-acetyltransferase